MRDFAVAEEADQRHVADLALDLAELGGLLAEDGGAAPQAGEVDRAARRATRAPLQVGQHAVEVGAGRCPVAAAEHDLLAILDLGGDGDDPAVHVDAQQVAHRVVGAVRAAQRESGEDVLADTAQVGGQLLADVLLEDLERRAAVEPVDQVVARHGDLVHRPDRRAALGQRGGHRHLGVEHDARDRALVEPSGDLGVDPARRHQPADQKALGRLGERRNQLGGARVARIGVNHGEMGLALIKPFPPLRDETGEVVADVVEQIERADRKTARHGGYGGFVEILSPGGADADAGGADPVGDAGLLHQGRGDLVELAGEPVGDVDEAQVGAGRQRLELGDAGVHGGAPVVPARVSHAEAFHRLAPFTLVKG